MAGLDIILPVYHPPAGWEDIVIDRFKALQTAMATHELRLIIVNDGSEHLDDSPAHTKLHAAIELLHWISYPVNKGKGYALREGVSRSEAALIIYTDIDWPYTEESMVAMILKLIEGADVVIGARDETYYAHLPVMRKRISRLLRKINAGILRLKVDDTQAGLKGFRKPVKAIFLSTTINRYLFDLEFVYRLSRSEDFVIADIPITLREGILFSKMNRKILLQEGLNFLKILIQKPQ